MLPHYPVLLKPKGTNPNWDRGILPHYPVLLKRGPDPGRRNQGHLLEALPHYPVLLKPGFTMIFWLIKVALIFPVFLR